MLAVAAAAGRQIRFGIAEKCGQSRVAGEGKEQNYAGEPQHNFVSIAPRIYKTGVS
jgi:hypothetical protein